MKQCEIDNIKRYYSECLVDSWEMNVEHLQYEQLTIIKKSLGYAIWNIKKEFNNMFEPILSLLSYKEIKK